LIARYRSLLAASMQTGVEIHLHQGKPEHVPRTRTVSARRPQWLITHGQLLERLFEQGPNYTWGPTVRQANVRRGTHKPATTRRSAGRSAQLMAASAVMIDRELQAL
jgi:hypothetical protein